MDSEVVVALDNLAFAVRNNAINVLSFVLPLAFGVFVAIWAIKYGYSRLIYSMGGSDPFKFSLSDELKQWRWVHFNFKSDSDDVDDFLSEKFEAFNKKYGYKD
jgi:hypothetical protein